MRDLKRHTTSTSTIFSNLTNVSIAAPPQNNGKVWRRMEKVKCGPCEMKLWKRVGSHHFSWRSGQHQHVVTAIQLPYDLSFAWCHDCHCDAFAALLHGPMIKWLGSSTCITVRCFLGVLSFKHPFSGLIIMTGTLNMFIYVERNLAETSQLSLYSSFLLLTSSLPSWQKWQHITHSPEIAAKAKAVTWPHPRNKGRCR